MQAELRKRNIPAVDLATLFLNNSHQGLYRDADTHWNERAAGLAAAETAQVLAGSGMLP